MYSKLFFIFYFVLLSGCAPYLPNESLPDAKTGYLNANYKIYKGDIVKNEKINLKDYQLVILTGLANYQYVFNTLNRMELFKHIETPYSLANEAHVSAQHEERFVHQIETDYAIKKLTKIYGKILLMNISFEYQVLGHINLTIVDPLAGKILFKTETVILINPLVNKNAFDAQLNAVANWVKENNQYEENK